MKAEMSVNSPSNSAGRGCYFPTRCVVGIVCFFGILVKYTINVFFSVAIVAMAKQQPESKLSNTTQLYGDILRTQLERDDQDVCPGGGSASNSDSQEGEFDWDSVLQGQALSAFYYGYLATQLLGGRLSEIYGSKIIFGPGLCLAGLLTLLGPVAARCGIGVLITVRVLTGAAVGPLVPAMHNMLISWYVPAERTFANAVIVSGIPLGMLVSMALSGVLIEAAGWPFAFYFFGGLGVAYIIPWMFLIYNTPEDHPRISEKERSYIKKNTSVTSIEKEKITYQVPWLAILFSGPLWVHNMMGIANIWVTFTISSELPTYLNQILHFNLQDTGVIAAVPYISSTITSILSTYISKTLIGKGYLSRINAYRLFDSISGFGCGLALLLITFMGCDSTSIVVLLIVAVATNGMFVGGSMINHVDLGSNFAGTLSGMNLTILSAMGFVSPSIIGAIINGQQTISRWKIVFYISAAVSAFGTLLYVLFGSAEEQSWNKSPKKIEKP